MKAKYTTCLCLCLLMLAMALPVHSGSSRGDVDMCDPETIGQIQKGKSSKEDVKQLFGEPKKVESAMNQGELWKYSFKATTHSGSGSVSSSSFGSISKGRGSGGIAMGQKSCNVWVYFEKNGIVRKVSESEISGGSGFMN